MAAALGCVILRLAVKLPDVTVMDLWNITHRCQGRLLCGVRGVFCGRLLFAGFVFLLLPLIVMPLDSEEHACSEHEELERNEDYRNPIHRYYLT
ncbi:hypothetical protein [Sphingobium sp.]|uniref:hypothetical protein n=1 Tax=Sphingobium sp. TaxID=1912891 RepID=UPI002BEBAB3A|nr:hypothetical protein [Sphingobium sp.]HUD93763.1 hypothetical protein [Sphingobium sp.]